VSALPADFQGRSVLDVGTFDGFYAFLAERRGAGRVVAVDNEQYRLWVSARWGIEPDGVEGFRAVHGLLGSSVEYRQLDAFELDRLDEHFDFVYLMGILHRVENPLGLLRVLRERTARGGTVLLETYGIPPTIATAPRSGYRSRARSTHATNSCIGAGFAHAGLARLARLAGFQRAEALAQVEVDGHPEPSAG
jgi:tRNA (mo5U34)-methyltransferase